MLHRIILTCFSLAVFFVTTRGQFCTTHDCEDKIVAIIGPTGVGKSSFCNLISGVRENDPETYPVCDGVYSCTYNTTTKRVQWMGSGENFTLVDTPGLGDSRGRDTQHIIEMTDELKRLGYVNAFVIMFNAANPRMDEHLQNLLKIFVKIFTAKFFSNVVMVFNKWEYHDKAEKRRAKIGLTKQNFTRDFNSHFQAHFGIDHKISAYYVDTMPDSTDDVEMAAINSELNEVHQKIMAMTPFECQDIEAVQSYVDELNNTINQEREQRDKMKTYYEEELRKKDENLKNAEEKLKFETMMNEEREKARERERKEREDREEREREDRNRERRDKERERKEWDKKVWTAIWAVAAAGGSAALLAAKVYIASWFS